MSPAVDTSPSTTVEWERPWLYPKQEDALFNDARWSLVEGATKSGKTVGAIVWIAEKAIMSDSGTQCWWVAPTNQQAKDAFERLKAMLQKTLGEPGQGAWRKNETLQYVEMFDRRIVFHSAQKPDHLYGAEVQAVVIDEATRCEEDAWTAVRSTLSTTRGPAVIIGNVRGRKNWAYQMCRRAENGEDWKCPNCDRVFGESMHYSKITALDAIDAGVLNKQELVDARQTMSEDMFRQLYLCEPAADGGNPFGMDHIRDCVIEGTSDQPPAVWGWDLGRHQDPTVGIALDRYGVVSTVRRWKDVGWSETIRRIINLTGKTPAMVDQTTGGEPILERLQEEGGKNFDGYKFSNARKKQTLMENLEVAIQRKEVRFPDGQVREELEHFEREYTRTNVLYKPMPGATDDHVDALALAVWKKDRMKKSTPTVAVPEGIGQVSYWKGTHSRV